MCDAHVFKNRERNCHYLRAANSGDIEFFSSTSGDFCEIVGTRITRLYVRWHYADDVAVCLGSTILKMGVLLPAGAQWRISYSRYSSSTPRVRWIEYPILEMVEPKHSDVIGIMPTDVQASDPGTDDFTKISTR